VEKFINVHTRKPEDIKLKTKAMESQIFAMSKKVVNILSTLITLNSDTLLCSVFTLHTVS
jgi:hypothetical protein